MPAAAVIARNVEDAHELALCRQNGRSRAGQKAIAVQIVFCAIDFHFVCFGQSRADGVGATLVFGPRGTASQSHPIGLVQKIQIAQCVHQDALCVGQDHHAVALAHLLEQVLHHRL